MKRFAMKDYGKAKEVLIEIEAQSRPMDKTHVRVELAAFAINPYDVAHEIKELCVIFGR